jgi:hypothetical protein
LPRRTPKSAEWARVHPIHRLLKLGGEFASSSRATAGSGPRERSCSRMSSVSKVQLGHRPAQPDAGALENMIRRFETMPSLFGTFYQAGRSARPSRGLAGGYQTGKQEVHIMITATSHPLFKLISNPNFDAAAPHDQNGCAIGRSDLRIIGKLPQRFGVRRGSRNGKRMRRNSEVPAGRIRLGRCVIGPTTGSPKRACRAAPSRQTSLHDQIPC